MAETTTPGRGPGVTRGISCPPVPGGTGNQAHGRGQGNRPWGKLFVEEMIGTEDGRARDRPW
jgi:hypothetical protein